jgi:hypothetical protein
MARRIKDVTIDKEGRDIGKVFRIRELPASQAERWALRAFLGIAKAGIEIPDDVAAMGMAGIALMGIRALSGIDFNEAEILMAEMMSCVVFVPDASRPQVTRPLVEDDIEEISTRLQLRKEILSIHVDFFTNAAD